MLTQTDRAFLIAIEPPLLASQMAIVAARLRANWPPPRLVELTQSESEAVVRLAARCLGLTGSDAQGEVLRGLLKHPREAIVAAAEDALWTLWMRTYDDEDLQGRFSDAVHRIQQGDFEAALLHLDEVIAVEPDKAEAYHQRALALHSLQRYAEAESAYLATLERNPAHFAAAAGLGHLHVERGEFAAALDFYKQALEIHPRLDEIRAIVPRLEAALKQRDVA